MSRFDSRVATEAAALLGRWCLLEPDNAAAMTAGMIHVLNACGSPIEQLFAIAMMRHRYSYGICLVAPEPGCSFSGFFKSANDVSLQAGLFQQVPASLKARNVVVDFLLADNDDAWALVIEIDGHEFHDRTKEQASRDKSRDRELLATGVHCIRFTGSEIWSDPDRCAEETIQLAFTLARKAQPA